MKEDRSETEKKNGFVFRDSSEGGICSNWSYTSVRVWYGYRPLLFFLLVLTEY